MSRPSPGRPAVASTLRQRLRPGVPAGRRGRRGAGCRGDRRRRRRRIGHRRFGFRQVGRRGAGREHQGSERGPGRRRATGLSTATSSRQCRAGPNKFLRRRRPGQPRPRASTASRCPSCWAGSLVAVVPFLGIPLLGCLPQAADPGCGPDPSESRSRRVRSDRGRESGAATAGAGGGDGVGRRRAHGDRSGGSDVALRRRAGASPACQSDGSNGCTAKLPCPTTNCPTVDVAPITDLSDGQYVFIKATSFPSGDTMRVAICSTSPKDSPDPTDPSCLNGNWEANYWDPTQVPISQDPANANLSQVSIPVFYDAAGSGDSPLPSHDVLNVNGRRQAGSSATTPPIPAPWRSPKRPEPVWAKVPPTPPRTRWCFPLTFRSQSHGCPASDPVRPDRQLVQSRALHAAGRGRQLQGCRRGGGPQYRHRQPVRRLGPDPRRCPDRVHRRPR